MQTPDLLLQTYQNVSEKMCDLPVFNAELDVAVIGFQEYAGRGIGVLLTPWCMNLVILAAEEDGWGEDLQGSKQLMALPSGQYEFIYNWFEGFGAFLSCSLFSPMEQFSDQETAVETAEEVMHALFKSENEELTDRQSALKAEKVEKAEKEELQKKARVRTAKPEKLSRRGFLTAGLGNRE
ncbi:[NiFe]-hydrogenase assembly chaperone HybE [Neptuniibacter sp.]|uniref:[NiFe]-hydrogenase assembly chaperone HybE n=1 Tax=Neptuniibacter sp. TaxID=1962643 RepID=UPI00261570F5|nr:[NiFe]-hydrogenase assembly chaperone HybE [Neptuniibacter sp.]MCP4598832.1 [NiFe]-hydrogenase assembly chaperone HybE [Neptuniibacter sp.]